MLRGATVSAFYNAWTYGACEPNPGIGGWGYLIHSQGDSLAAAGRTRISMSVGECA